MKKLVTVFLFLAACSNEVEGVDVDLAMEPLTIAYSKLNSNNGAPICPISGSQCVATDHRGTRVTRMLRTWVMSMNPNGGKNAWQCSGPECVSTRDLSRAFLYNCTTSGPLGCAFGTTFNVDEGQVGIDALGRGANFFFHENGGIGQANPAGPVFHYTE